MAESPRALGKPNTKSTVRTIWGFEELAGGRKLVQRLEVWNRKGEEAIIKNGVWSRQRIALVKDPNQAHVSPFSVHATFIQNLVLSNRSQQCIISACNIRKLGAVHFDLVST